MPTLLEQISDLDTWRREAEEASIGHEWAEFGQQAGLPLPEDEANLKIYSKKEEQLSKLLLFLMENNVIPRDQVPDLLYFDAIAKKQRSVTSSIHKKIRDARKKELRFSGYKVSIDSWRQFNLQHLKEPDLRERVFNGLINEANENIGPLVGQFFDLIRQNYVEYDLNPIGVYCKRAGTTVEQLKEVVDRSGRLAKKPFLEMAESMWPKILGHGVNPIDDYYVWRPIVFQEFDSIFKGVEPMKLFLDIMEDMKMNAFLRYMTIDDKPRPGKYASPSCWFIKVPTIGKILFQKSRPFADATSGFHEGGHGVHFSSMNPKAPYEDRYLVHTSTAEIPSTAFESIVTDTSFLERRLEVKPKDIETIHEREIFFELYYLTFYAANSMLKIELWEKRLDVEKATDRYAELTKNYGLPLPGSYWLAHHVISMYAMYAPSYLLANIRRASLLRKIRDEHGDEWYKEPGAGKYWREEFCWPGAAVNLDSFPLTSNDYFKDSGLM